tara:strand:+ start:1902 stop:2627 length:726 start_codon:yes stop_codon:yes gene_type:complete
MLVIIQARMGSTRLPGKVLMNIDGMPSILYQYERLISYLSKDFKIIVATTTSKKDDILVEVLKKNKIAFFRGSEEDVLQRYVDCAEYFQSENIIRINADCPLICPKILEKTSNALMASKDIDYASTILEETFPLGMHVEATKLSVLKAINKENLTQEEREHVTPYIYNNKHLFNLISVTNKINEKEFRVTVDYQEDLNVIRAIANNFSKKKFYCNDITKFLKENPKVSRQNIHLMKSQKLN